MDFSKEIETLKGVGPKAQEGLNRLGIYTIMDLLLYFPREYDIIGEFNGDFALNDGKKIIIKVIVTDIKRDLRVSGKRGQLTITSIVFDYCGKIITGKWFNSPYVKNSYKLNEEYTIVGKVKKVGSHFEISSPSIVKEYVNDTKIVPKYGLTKSVTTAMISKLVLQIITENNVKENLPECLKENRNMISLNSALNNIHFPKDTVSLEKAKRRLSYQELLIHSLKTSILKQSRIDNKGIGFSISNELIELKKSLPFELTQGQNKVIREILIDEKKDRPMNRIVQGDVGSGKTVVAIISLFNIIKNGYQGAFMAPTEILARQHYEECKNMLEKFNVNVELLVGSTSAKNKKIIKEDLNNGKIDLLIGTHALIEDDVIFKKLGIIVTDEQHRFGVGQRKKLINKNIEADVLIMTATPIPRTLCLCIYGDLDISIIDELPKGRKPIETKVYTKDNKDKAYEQAIIEIQQGRQVYIVCPLVQENEKLERKSIEELFEEISKSHFKKYRIGVLHGKMNSKDKENIMENFKSGELQILIATTVIEVGVNVPNATTMIIENAECFGLSQLHQLRGRVGRGCHKSYAMLLASSNNKNSIKKLKIMENSNDGFFIANEDMKIRGTGEVFGFRQSGEDGFIVADIYRDIEIFKESIEDSEYLLELSKNNKIDIVSEVKGNMDYTLKNICLN